MTTLPPFERHQPESVDAASELLGQLGEDAVLYAGGTELFLVFKFGFAEYPHLIDLKKIAELRGIERRNGSLWIGAAETHRSIERNREVRAHWPALAAMERGVGNLRVRTAGSIGGNLCFADPHSDPATFLLAAGATVHSRRAGQPSRQIPIGEFTRGSYENALAHDELLCAIEVPALAPSAAIAHRKFVLHERPAITVACHLRLQDDRLADVRLAVGSVGTVARRSEAAEQALDGLEASQLDQALASASQLAADGSDPVEDANGSVEYKRHLVSVISGRVVQEAVKEARARARAGGEAF